jgi:hypothetical protein
MSEKNDKTIEVIKKTKANILTSQQQKLSDLLKFTINNLKLTK